MGVHLYQKVPKIGQEMAELWPFLQKPEKVECHGSMLSIVGQPKKVTTTRKEKGKERKGRRVTVVVC